MKKLEIIICIVLLLFCSSCAAKPPADSSPSQPPEASDTNPDLQNDDVTYVNDEYGFTFTLPESWSGYTIISDTWDGESTDVEQAGKVIETGALLSIRHPLWTTQNPRQDIPIMVFTTEQWDLMNNEEGFHIGAAPMNPSELGRNAEYVFALPARYNYAFLTGYEEVEEILDSNALQPAEKQ